MISYNQLLQFVTVVQHRSMSKAAEKMYIAQPAISASIKKMETELGVQLFYYENRQLYLTEDGKNIYQIASEILYSYSKLENYTSYNTQPEYTYFRYYASPAIHDILTPALDLPNQFPRMRFLFYTCSNHQEFLDFLCQAEQQENIFGLFFIPSDVFEQFSFPQTLSVKIIASYQTQLITSLYTQHPVCSKKVLYKKDVQNIPFINYTNNLCHPLADPAADLISDHLTAPNTSLINSYLYNYPDSFIIGCLPFSNLAQEPLKRIPIADAPATNLVLLYNSSPDDTFYSQLFSLVHSYCAV